MRKSLQAKVAIAATLMASACAHPLQETGSQCVQNCFLTGVVGVGATAACGNGNDYVSQAICYCQTPGLGDAYGRCLARCPEGDMQQGQELREQVCAAAAGGQEKEDGHEHGHDDEHKHKQEHEHGDQNPGQQVAGIIGQSIPQAEGNMGEYAQGGAQGEQQQQQQQQPAAAAAAPAPAAEQAGWTSSQDMQLPTQTAQASASASQTPSSSSSSSSSKSSQTFLTPTKSHTKTHTNTTATTSPTSTTNDLDSSAGESFKMSWGVAAVSSLVVWYLV
ncbi:hypothetical protein E3P99_02641 [Wallemia hederae]|uniref:Extracellular membrane protein CFEM domain-containing protein n=1 Tax=Wallemia hederae TaxID=1540922 RepID=A0A4T0FK12_9BASI|nr:hypothetical protein E3P99_02641 [Wallemia hederae]